MDRRFGIPVTDRLRLERVCKSHHRIARFSSIQTWFKGMYIFTKHRGSFCFALAVPLTLLAAPSDAIELSEIYVFSENDSEAAKACGVSGIAAAAAAESVFRQNRIRVKSENTADYMFYIRITTIGSNYGCTMAYEAQLLYPVFDAPPQNKKNVWSFVHLCNKAGLMTDYAGTAGSRILEQIRAYAEQCVSEVLKK
jgi:hypothetical protein